MGTRQSTESSEPVVLTRHTSDVTRPPLPGGHVGTGREYPREVPRRTSHDEGGRDRLYPSPPPDYNDIPHFQPHPSYSQRSRSLQSRPLPSLPPDSQYQQQITEFEALLAELGISTPSTPPPLPVRHPPPLSRTLHSRVEGERRRHHHRTYQERDRSFMFNSDNPLLLLRERSKRKCPHCFQDISLNEFQTHVTSCNTQPSIQYNEDVLKTDGGECAICLEDLIKGDEIARLPCLCVYHIKCIEEWFRVKEMCPQHPDLKLTTS